MVCIKPLMYSDTQFYQKCNFYKYFPQKISENFFPKIPAKCLFEGNIRKPNLGILKPILGTASPEMRHYPHNAVPITPIIAPLSTPYH
jgi:hypothetical protein